MSLLLKAPAFAWGNLRTETVTRQCRNGARRTVLRVLSRCRRAGMRLFRLPRVWPTPAQARGLPGDGTDGHITHEDGTEGFATRETAPTGIETHKDGTDGLATSNVGRRQKRFSESDGQDTDARVHDGEVRLLCAFLYLPSRVKAGFCL